MAQDPFTEVSDLGAWSWGAKRETFEDPNCFAACRLSSPALQSERGPPAVPRTAALGPAQTRALKPPLPARQGSVARMRHELPAEVSCSAAGRLPTEASGVHGSLAGVMDWGQRVGGLECHSLSPEASAVRNSPIASFSASDPGAGTAAGSALGGWELGTGTKGEQEECLAQFDMKLVAGATPFPFDMDFHSASSFLPVDFDCFADFGSGATDDSGAAAEAAALEPVFPTPEALQAVSGALVLGSGLKAFSEAGSVQEVARVGGSGGLQSARVRVPSQQEQEGLVGPNVGLWQDMPTVQHMQNPQYGLPHKAHREHQVPLSGTGHQQQDLQNQQGVQQMAAWQQHSQQRQHEQLCVAEQRQQFCPQTGLPAGASRMHGPVTDPGSLTSTVSRHSEPGSFPGEQLGPKQSLCPPQPQGVGQQASPLAARAAPVARTTGFTLQETRRDPWFRGPCQGTQEDVVGAIRHGHVTSEQGIAGGEGAGLGAWLPRDVLWQDSGSASDLSELTAQDTFKHCGVGPAAAAEKMVGSKQCKRVSSELSMVLTHSPLCNQGGSHNSTGACVPPAPSSATATQGQHAPLTPGPGPSVPCSWPDCAALAGGAEDEAGVVETPFGALCGAHQALFADTRVRGGLLMEELYQDIETGAEMMDAALPEPLNEGLGADMTEDLPFGPWDAEVGLLDVAGTWAQKRCGSAPAFQQDHSSSLPSSSFMEHMSVGPSAFPRHSESTTDHSSVWKRGREGEGGPALEPEDESAPECIDSGPGMRGNSQGASRRRIWLQGVSDAHGEPGRSCASSWGMGLAADRLLKPEEAASMDAQPARTAGPVPIDQAARSFTPPMQSAKPSTPQKLPLKEAARTKQSLMQQQKLKALLQPGKVLQAPLSGPIFGVDNQRSSVLLRRRRRLKLKWGSHQPQQLALPQQHSQPQGNVFLPHIQQQMQSCMTASNSTPGSSNGREGEAPTLQPAIPAATPADMAQTGVQALVKPSTGSWSSSPSLVADVSGGTSACRPSLCAPHHKPLMSGSSSGPCPPASLLVLPGHQPHQQAPGSSPPFRVDGEHVTTMSTLPAPPTGLGGGLPRCTSMSSFSPASSGPLPPPAPLGSSVKATPLLVGTSLPAAETRPAAGPAPSAGRSMAAVPLVAPSALARQSPMVLVPAAFMQAGAQGLPLFAPGGMLMFPRAHFAKPAKAMEPQPVVKRKRGRQKKQPSKNGPCGATTNLRPLVPRMAGIGASGDASPAAAGAATARAGSAGGAVSAGSKPAAPVRPSRFSEAMSSLPLMPLSLPYRSMAAFGLSPMAVPVMVPLGLDARAQGAYSGAPLLRVAQKGRGQDHQALAAVAGTTEQGAEQVLGGHKM